MKLYRALATAATAAVVGPVALFAAPAAFAADGDARPAAIAPGQPDPAFTGGVTGNGKPPVQQPAQEPSGDGTPTAKPSPTVSASASAKPSQEPGKPGTTPSPAHTRPTFCSPIFDVDRGKTGLRGLPSRIVAGSGWHEFTYRVANVSKLKVMETDLSLDRGTADPKLRDVAELDVSVEWYSPANGKWKPVLGEGAKFLDNEDFVTVKNLKPGEYADVRMRIKAGEKAKPGTGYFFTTGYTWAEDDQCGFDEISQFDYTVLAAGAKPGKVDDAKSKPGSSDDAKKQQQKQHDKAGQKPAGDSGKVDQIPVSGNLAETGSSSMLPTVAGIGGAAVAVGAATVFVVRRRKTSLAG
ncbi:LAETG motif-containing sortase-dependent surface protein [Streptomyces abikoensis]|uniref:LAETG motif-containing sortase-dependent surface protein n=1 Tax=Streptomyces abikoensis TaxID=97398 RepID=A0ABW7TDC5_9ACTN